MYENKNIEKIKKEIENNIGKQFNIAAKHGRKKVLFENCTLEAAYPSIFVAKTSTRKNVTSTCISFSYTDILTKNVYLLPCCDGKKKKGA